MATFTPAWLTSAGSRATHVSRETRLNRPWTEQGLLIFKAVVVADWECSGCLCVWMCSLGLADIVYGPLVNGATTVLFESIPTYPNHCR